MTYADGAGELTAKLLKLGLGDGVDDDGFRSEARA
jgi:hypothetical protein